MTLGALSPFGRGTNAPLAGRTVLQIVPPLDAGGDERSTIAVAAALVEAGARALVASDPGELASEAQALGALHIPFPASTKNPIAMSLNVRRLVRILHAERVDLVHARSRAAAWSAIKACAKRAIPVVTTAPGEGGLSRRSSFGSASVDGDFVIAPSQWAADRASDVFPDAATKIRVVRPGVELGKLAPAAVSRQRVAAAREVWGAAPHERIVLLPARLAPGRGQKELIEAAAILHARGLADIRFVLAGDGPKPAFGRDLDALAGERGVKLLVVRVAAAADRPAAIIGAAVAVFPTSEAEGVTRAAIEATAAGALVVVSDVGPAREIVAAPPHEPPELRSGWLIPPRNPAALAGAIEQALMLGASTREAIRQRSRERAAKLYSRERMTRDTLAVYAEALLTRGRDGFERL